MCAFQLRYDSYRAAVDDHLGGLFADAKDKPYRRLQEAMRYSLLSGGKRVRPVMTLAFCDMLGGQWREALPFACALELVHTYSLIHDDLPCMDDDDLRRGRPTCHKVYGETMAVLAGDALQGEAFGLIAAAPAMTAQQRIDAVAVLSAACGGGGMVAGQVLDVDHLAQGEADLRLLHRLKTGAMLQAARSWAVWPPGRTTACGSGPGTTAATSAWPSRSGTTCWTWWRTRGSWASPSARTGRRASEPLWICWGWRPAKPWWRRRPPRPRRRWRIFRTAAFC